MGGVDDSMGVYSEAARIATDIPIVAASADISWASEWKAGQQSLQGGCLAKTVTEARHSAAAGLSGFGKPLVRWFIAVARYHQLSQPMLMSDMVQTAAGSDFRLGERWPKRSLAAVTPT